ncbi:hypothetical protein [Aeromicrobium sp.]|uniref:hypothetical protein n=1 Tax=Aeromicrobium sp. TaxID=1871063 RepID=UPI003D6B223E
MTVAAVSTLVFVGGVATPASAQPVIQDGLVNVSVGNVTILKNVNVGVAAQVAAEVCGVDVGPIAVLGNAVDAGDGPATICHSAQGPVKIEQNT